MHRAPTQPIHNGRVEYIQSNHCSNLRGGLLATLSALQFLEHDPVNRANNSRINICSRDSKILKRIQKAPKHNKTAKEMLRPEQELLDEILILLHQYNKFSTHQSTKHDLPESPQQQTMLACIKSTTDCQETTLNRYTTPGKAKVFLNHEEVSADIELTLRHAATTSQLCQYMTTKYKWAEGVPDKIDWAIHSNSLNNFSQTQRKTLTQAIHEWLPLNGHPSQANTTINQNCPCCKTQPETQETFYNCPSLHDS
jgi:hypothetical protein